MTVTTLSGRTASAAANGGCADVDDALGDAVVVAQVDEQQVAVVALAMDPAGQADASAAGVGEAQRAAGVRAIGVHGRVTEVMGLGERKEMRGEKTC